MPSIVKGKLIIRVMAVNRNTNTLLTEEQLHQDHNAFVLPIMIINENKYPIVNSIVQKEIKSHLLSYDQAINHLSNWKKKSMLEIDEITSFNGQRLRYTSYSSSLIKHIGSLPSTNTNIAWGIDEKGKVTTVIIPISTNKNELLEVFDNGRKCPSHC